MSSFVSRGAVLASARLLNQALALLSPLLLVRLLDIVDYGRYRQFMAVAMLVTSLGGFALTANLTYLLARTPDRAPADITKTTVLMFLVAVVSALIVALAHPWIVPDEIAGSWWLLSLYVFMFLNLEVVVAYWLARAAPWKSCSTRWSSRSGGWPRCWARRCYFREVEMIFVTIVCAEARQEHGHLPVAARARPAGVPLGARSAARAGAAGGAARPRLHPEQGQRVRPRGGGHGAWGRCRWLSTPPRPTRCRW